MKLAVIGAGSVGGTLGAAWGQKAGHEIFFGVRSPNSDKTQALLQTLGGKARAGTAAVARLLEARAMLWIELALERGLGRNFAFAAVRR